MSAESSAEFYNMLTLAHIKSDEYLRHTCWEATLELGIVGKRCDVRAKMPAFIIRRNLHTHGFEAVEVHSQCKCKCK